MGELSIWHWLVVLVVVLLLFGSGKVSTLMGDFASGIKAFKKTMAEKDEPETATAAKPAEPLELTANAKQTEASRPKETTAAEHHA